MTPLERQLDLVALLLNARRPVSRREILEAFPEEYGGSLEGAERKLSRDKDDLRAQGVPVEYVEGDDDHEAGYVIDREQFYLPEVAFTPDEKAALFAVGAAALKGAFPLRGELAHAVAKLGAIQDRDGRARSALYTSVGPRSPFAELVTRATAERLLLELVYPPEPRPRIVEPYAAVHRRGRLSFVGFCRLRGDLRTFHADRITRCKLVHRDAKGPEFTVPADFDPAPHLPEHPWQVRAHAPVSVTLAFSDELRELGPKALGLRGPGPYEVTHLRGLVSQVLAMGPGVRIVDPPEARKMLREALAGLAASLEAR